MSSENLAQVELAKQVERWRTLGARTLEEWILARGRPFDVSDYRHRKGKKRECFKNAWEAAQNGFLRDFRYAEGYAVSDMGLLIHHAWVVTHEDEALEVTWDAPGQGYYGVIVPNPVGYAILDKFRVWGMFPHGIAIFESDVVKKPE